MESNKQMASVASTLTAALASSVNANTVGVANPKAGSAMVEVANKTGGGGKPKIGVFTTSFGVFKKVDVAKPQATAAETNVGVANQTVGVAKPPVPIKEYVPVPAPKIDAPKQTANS